MVFSVDPCFPFGIDNEYDKYQQSKHPDNITRELQQAVQNMSRTQKMNNEFAKVIKAFRTYDIIPSPPDSIVKI